jgi:hypothetical protein
VYVFEGQIAFLAEVLSVNESLIPGSEFLHAGLGHMNGVVVLIGLTSVFFEELLNSLISSIIVIELLVLYL